MKPFPAKRRNLILIFGMIIFICFIPFIILSAMGYSLDFRSNDSSPSEDQSFFSSLFSIKKTGGIYVRSDVFGTVFYINDKEFTDRGVLNRNIFAQNLVPGIYNIRIEKEGYRDWVRKITVVPNKVTEAYLFTLPEELIFTEVPQYLDSNGMPTTTPQISKVSSRAIKINPEYTEVLELFTSKDLSTSTSKLVSSIKNTAKISATTSSTTLANLEVEKTKIYGDEILRNLYATSTGKTIKFTWDGSYDQTPYYFCEFEICQDQVSLILDEPIKKFYLFPSRDDIVIVELDSGIYYVDISGKSANGKDIIYQKPKSSVYVREGEIFIKDGQKLFLMSY